MRAITVFLIAIAVSSAGIAQPTIPDLIKNTGLKVVVLKASESAKDHPLLKSVGTISSGIVAGVHTQMRTTITATRTRPCFTSESDMAQPCTEFFLETHLIR